MFGQSDTGPDEDQQATEWTAEQRAGAFPAKSVGQRFAIVVAGPVANFILSIVLFAGVFAFVGQSQTLPEATMVLQKGAVRNSCPCLRQIQTLGEIYCKKNTNKKN